MAVVSSGGGEALEIVHSYRWNCAGKKKRACSEYIRCTIQCMLVVAMLLFLGFIMQTCRIVITHMDSVSEMVTLEIKSYPTLRTLIICRMCVLWFMYMWGLSFI